MILSDSSIEGYILKDEIRVDPLPQGKQIQPASLDMRLGEELFHIEKDKHVKSPQHQLQPGERYLGHTKERISLPNDIAAQLAGRSSIGRQGVIVHKTAGFCDPGFSGQVTLELMNLGNEPVTLETGQRVAQLVFFQLDFPSAGYDGGYQNQSGATEAYQD